jgi:sugar phosphate isomerase/epimerase
MIRLGGYGLRVSADDPAAFAKAHVAFGYRAAYCPPVSIGDLHRIAGIRDAFAAVDVTIAEVGIWRNLITPDESTRKANLDYAAERLALADEVGALCAVSYVGSFVVGTEYAPAAENLSQHGFDAAVETARLLIDTVKPKRARFALEMMQYTLPDGVEIYRDLIVAIDRPAFAAHLDPVNLVLTPRQYFDTGALIRSCFATLGPWIVSCHAKDIILRDQAALHFDETRVGLGHLDYRTYLSELDRLANDVPLLLEHLRDEEYAVARDQLFAVGEEIGVGFKGRAPARLDRIGGTA